MNRREFTKLLGFLGSALTVPINLSPNIKRIDDFSDHGFAKDIVSAVSPDVLMLYNKGKLIGIGDKTHYILEQNPIEFSTKYDTWKTFNYLPPEIEITSGYFQATNSRKDIMNHFALGSTLEYIVNRDNDISVLGECILTHVFTDHSISDNGRIGITVKGIGSPTFAPKIKLDEPN
jgi:hypothetical protein